MGRIRPTAARRPRPRLPAADVEIDLTDSVEIDLTDRAPTPTLPDRYPRARFPRPFLP